MSTYLIRAATARDAKAVTDLSRRLRRELRLTGRKQEHLRSGMLWVVEAGRGEIVGSCGVREGDDGTWQLHSLYLAPDWRGFGLGRALLERAIRAVERGGGLELRFEASPECTSAIALAERAGFVASGGSASELVLVRRVALVS